MTNTFKNENGHLIANVSFDGEEIKSATAKAVQKLCENVTVPGFRKGKAPLDKAARMLRGEAVMDETVNQLLRKLDKNFEKDATFQSYLNERKLLNGFRPQVSLDKYTAETADFTVTYTLKPEVAKLAEYKNLPSDAVLAVVDDAAVEAEITKLANDNAELVPSEKEAEMGDTCNIDFVGLMDGKEFDGGSSKGFDLVLGSKHFVPGFEEQIVSHKAGDKFDVNVVMPDNYPAPLTSKPAVFKVTLNAVKVKEVPEINDEFATTLSGTYANTENLEQLKTKVKENLETNAKNNYLKDKVNGYLNAVKTASEYVIAPEYLDRLVKDREDQDSKTLEQQGLSLDEYLKLINTTKEAYEANLKTGVEGELKGSLIYDAIAAAEKIAQPTQQEVEGQIGSSINSFVTNYTNYLKNTGMAEDQIQNQVNNYLNQVYSSILTGKVQAKLLELNDPEATKLTEKPAEEAKAEEPAPAAEEPAPVEEPKAEEPAPVEEAAPAEEPKAE